MTLLSGMAANWLSSSSSALVAAIAKLDVDGLDEYLDAYFDSFGSPTVGIHLESLAAPTVSRTIADIDRAFRKGAVLAGECPPEAWFVLSQVGHSIHGRAPILSRKDGQMAIESFDSSSMLMVMTFGGRLDAMMRSVFMTACLATSWPLLGGVSLAVENGAMQDRLSCVGCTPYDVLGELSKQLTSVVLAKARVRFDIHISNDEWTVGFEPEVL